MTPLTAFKTGMRRANRTTRLVLFAWLVQFLAAFVVAIPAMLLFDRSVRETVYEEILLQRLDENWLATFRFENEGNELARLFGPGLTSVGPFLHHTDALITGDAIRPLASFLGRLFFGWTFDPSGLTLPMLLLLPAVFANVVFSAGYVATYRGEYPPTIAEFLSLGASHLGPFLRLLLVSFLALTLIAYPFIGWMSERIAVTTASSASEATPFAWYMVRNAGAFVLLIFITLSIDIARVRIVLEQRSSAIVAFLAGMHFVLLNAPKLSGLALMYILSTLLGMILYGLIESALDQTTYAAIILLLILQQTYMLLRSFLRASLIASETVFFQTSETHS